MQDKIKLFENIYNFTRIKVASAFSDTEPVFNEKLNTSLQHLSKNLKAEIDGDIVNQVVDVVKTTISMDYKNHKETSTRMALDYLNGVTEVEPVAQTDPTEPTQEKASNTAVVSKTLSSIDWNDLQTKKLTLEKEFNDIRARGNSDQAKIANYIKIFKDYKTLYDTYKIALEMASEIGEEQKAQIEPYIQKLSSFAVPELDPKVFG